VKVNRVSGHKFELIEFSRVPFDPEIPRTIRISLSSKVGAAEILRPRHEGRAVGHHPLGRGGNPLPQDPKVPRTKSPILPTGPIKSIPPSRKRKTSSILKSWRGRRGRGEEDRGDGLYGPAQEVEDLKDLFVRSASAGGHLIVPFAFQTLLRSGRLEAHGTAVSNLYIGRDWSRIDIFSDGNLVLSRGIKAGIRTMVEALQHEIEQNWFELTLAKSPTSDQGRIRAIKMRLKQELEIAQTVFFGPIHGTADAGRPGQTAGH